MSRSPYAAEAHTPICEVLSNFLTLEIRHAPVVRGKTLIGILSDRDIRDYSMPLIGEDFMQLENPHVRLNAPVSDIMSTEILSVQDTAPLEEAIDVLIEHKLSALPVVAGDGSSLVGIVSYIDILRELKKTLSRAA